MTIRISAEEKAVLDYVDGSGSTSADDLNAVINHYTKIARTQMSKKKTINIQLLESDIEQIRQSRIPYQPLISSLIHQYATGKIKLEN